VGSWPSSPALLFSTATRGTPTSGCPHGMPRIHPRRRTPSVARGDSTERSGLNLIPELAKEAGHGRGPERYGSMLVASVCASLPTCGSTTSSARPPAPWNASHIARATSGARPSVRSGRTASCATPVLEPSRTSCSDHRRTQAREAPRTSASRTDSTPKQHTRSG